MWGCVVVNVDVDVSGIGVQTQCFRVLTVMMQMYKGCLTMWMWMKEGVWGIGREYMFVFCGQCSKDERKRKYSMSMKSEGDGEMHVEKRNRERECVVVLDVWIY